MFYVEGSRPCNSRSGARCGRFQTLRARSGAQRVVFRPRCTWSGAQHGSFQTPERRSTLRVLARRLLSLSRPHVAPRRSRGGERQRRQFILANTEMVRRSAAVLAYRGTYPHSSSPHQANRRLFVPRQVEERRWFCRRVGGTPASNGITHPWWQCGPSHQVPSCSVCLVLATSGICKAYNLYPAGAKGEWLLNSVIRCPLVPYEKALLLPGAG